ncbi:hypothetical protein [Saccharothrix australiensis]|uniref:Rhodanese domain-containing protein n=1 Tax=Saccharothrix australiensis TaxID=2072 RepID=A0A495W1F6_9PSEU|nr:hypothetical protein [Saccharothrix australiensis]RKT53698.1 hypothetical protein C8E97_2277 [Saccharothrix australiensis]
MRLGTRIGSVLSAVLVLSAGGGIAAAEPPAARLGQWSAWGSLGQPSVGFAGAPATVARGGGVANVYARGGDGALWQLSWDGARWGAWQRHNDGAVLDATPAVGSFNANHEHVFIRTPNGQLHQKYWTLAGGWSAWGSLGRPSVGFVGAPATVARGGGVANVYVRGGDGALWQLSWDGTRWGAWQRHNDGFALGSAVAVSSFGADHEQLFARGTDGLLHQKYWTRTGGWSSWASLGRPSPGFVDAPATVARGGGVANVYVRGGDGALWQLSWDGTRWGAWQRHNDGAVLDATPAVGSFNANHEHVFIRTPNGQLHQKWWTA